jgi:ribonuclease P protein subunit RPR2
MGTIPSHQRIALERVGKLFAQAEESFKEHPELSKRYIALARRIATRYKVRLTVAQKRLFCKKCNAYLKNGINSRARLSRGTLVVTCLECKNIRRMNY